MSSNESISPQRQTMRRKRCPELKKKHKRTNTKNKLLLSNPTPKLKQKEKLRITCTWSKMNLCKTWRKCKCPNKRLFRKKQNNLKNNEKNYMDKDLFPKSSSRNALCWAFYYVTNNKQVELTPPQAMHCIFSITIQFWN